MTDAALVVAVALVALTVGALLTAVLDGRTSGLSRYRKTLVSVAGTVITYVMATYPTDPLVQKYLAPLAGPLVLRGRRRYHDDAVQGASPRA